EKVEILSDTLYAFVDHIDFKEKSGFNLDTLQGNFKMSAIGLSLDDLTLVTPNSNIKGELAFEYSTFSNFKYFIDSVNIRSSFDNSVLNFADISYFAPALE